MATRMLCDVCGQFLDGDIETATVAFKRIETNNTGNVYSGPKFDLDLCRKHKNELEQHVRSWIGQPMLEVELDRNTPAT